MPVKGQYVVLHNFNGVNGANPYGSLTLSGKILYGTTRYGGTTNYGTIFSIDTNGNGYKVLHNFDSVSATGFGPMYTKLALLGKSLYGLAAYGGANNDGCIFSIDTNGSNYKDVLDFNGSNGMTPCGSLTLSGNKFFGMTAWGGGTYNKGCIFSIDTNGNNYNDILNFNFSPTHGDVPFGSLIVSGRLLYGMTSGTVVGYGNIFSIDTDGTSYKDLYDFLSNGDIGTNPYGSLTLARNKLYGMTFLGGNTPTNGVIFSIDTNGGTSYNTIYNFRTGSGAGNEPYGSLTLSGNRLYGMTSIMGDSANGTIFYIDTNGILPVEIHHTRAETGMTPYGDLTLSGGSLYGMMSQGGTNGDGVIFKIGVNTLAGINEVSSNSEGVKLYPNPNKGVFIIQSSSAEKKEVEVYNSLGQKIYSNTFTNSQLSINLGGQPSGIYLYRITSERGDQVAAGKFVIE